MPLQAQGHRSERQCWLFSTSRSFASCLNSEKPEAQSVDLRGSPWVCIPKHLLQCKCSVIPWQVPTVVFWARGFDRKGLDLPWQAAFIPAQVQLLFTWPTLHRRLSPPTLSISNFTKTQVSFTILYIWPFWHLCLKHPFPALTRR